MDAISQYENIEPRFLFSKQHIGYINSLSIERSEYGLLLCGGADSSVTIWDLKQEQARSEDGDTTRENEPAPLCRLDRKTAHQFGISKLQWWPTDAAMFLTGSYDGKVKVWDSEELEEVYSFDMGHKVYSFDINSIEENGLVAVGMDHPLIRILDLRVGGSAQTLKGHSSGSVCSVHWSPAREFILASGGTDGTVRIWDIRQARQQLGSMDLLRTNKMQTLSPLEFRKAHRAVCNGVQWHPQKQELISVGLDNKARIWDLSGDISGVNKSVNFGPLFQDRRQQTLEPCLSPEEDLEDEIYVLLPSDTGDILMSQYSDGKLVRRLVPPGREVRNNRQACVVSRGPKSYEYYSATCDGSVIKWGVHNDTDEL